jgi:CheY-like chemotaxis protein
MAMSALAFCRILVVEDDVVVAFDLESVLAQAGCEVIGPARSVEEAVRLMHGAQFDAAVLDINLDGQMAYPVADALADAGIPFVWVTGYSQASLPERHRARPFVSKPYIAAKVVQNLTRLLHPTGPQ